MHVAQKDQPVRLVSLPCASPWRCRARTRSIGSVGLASLLASCDRVPVQDIAGSFFPSWLLCGALGIGAAILIRLVLLWSGVHPHLPVPLLFYPAVAASAAMLIWLLSFGG